MFHRRLFLVGAMCLGMLAMPLFAQKLSAPYWRVDDDTDSFLELASNANTDRTFSPVLWIDGVKPLALPAVTVPAHGTVRVNLRPFLKGKIADFAIPGDARRLQQPRNRVWQGSATLEGDEIKAIYGWFQIETEHTSVNSMFASDRRAASHITGMWWRPTPGTVAELSLVNTASAPVIVDTWLYTGEGKVQGRSLTFGPGHGKILTPEEMLGPGAGLPDLGGVELITRNGEKAIQGWILLRDTTHGFATPVSMQAPAVRLSNKAHLPGALLGDASHEFGFPSGVHFRPKILLTNRTDAPIDLFIELSSGMSDLAARDFMDDPFFEPVPVHYQPVQLPVQTLAPRSVAILDLADLRDEMNGVLPDGFAGIELTHTGAPGDLYAEALTVDDQLRYAFHDPFMDEARAPQFMTTVSFDLSRDRNKVFVFKQTGDEAAVFHFNVFYRHEGEERVYQLGRVLDAGAALSIDLRRLRDDAVPDLTGQVLPANMMFGHVMVQPTGPGLRAGDYAFDAKGSFASCFDPCECDPPGFYCQPVKRGEQGDKRNIICDDDPFNNSYTVAVKWSTWRNFGTYCHYERCGPSPGDCNAPQTLTLPNTPGTNCPAKGLQRLYTIYDFGSTFSCGWSMTTTWLNYFPCFFAKDQ